MDAFAAFGSLRRLAIGVHQQVLVEHEYSMGDQFDEASQQEDNRLKEEDPLNEENKTVASLYFKRIKTLEEMCLIGWRCSEVYKAVRDEKGTVTALKTRDSSDVSFIDGDQYWEEGKPMRGKCPAVMRLGRHKGEGDWF